jgi:CspA family cold shock protein
VQGQVFFFNEHRGYGIIKAEGVDFFFHRSNIMTLDALGFRSLGTADRVQFDPIKGEKGHKAINIKRIEKES